MRKVNLHAHHILPCTENTMTLLTLTTMSLAPRVRSTKQNEGQGTRNTSLSCERNSQLTTLHEMMMELRYVDWGWVIFSNVCAGRREALCYIWVAMTTGSGLKGIPGCLNLCSKTPVLHKTIVEILCKPEKGLRRNSQSNR